MRTGSELRTSARTERDDAEIGMSLRQPDVFGALECMRLA